LETVAKKCRGWGGVNYIKRKTMLFIYSISVQENRGEEITFAAGSGLV
jgi:hypothetical protein